MAGPAPVTALLALSVLVAASTLLVHAGESAGHEDVFRERILPIFRSKDPSSCTECHLAAVELKDYIRPTTRETFLSMRDQGLIDLDKPEESRILELIRMAPQKPAPLPSRRRAEELAAFEAWVLSASRDPALRDAPPLEEKKRARPGRPDAVIRHARKSRVLESFEELVWADRERCASCHRPPKNAKQVREFGERVSWIVPGDPAATLDHLVENGLLDSKRPLDSLLLTKPTLKVEHKGGVKLLAGDETYERWIAWIEDWAKTVNDGYRKAAELPERTEVSMLSENFIRIASPKSWKGYALRLDVHAWDEKAGDWEKQRCGASTRLGGPKGAMARLYVYAAPGSERLRHAKEKGSLPPGRYQARIHLDRRFNPKKGGAPRFRRKPDHTLDLDLTWKTGMRNRNVIDVR